MITYPQISPDIVRVGNFAIRWYSVMYLLGYVIGFKLAKNRIKRALLHIDLAALDSLISYWVVGMLLGARLFYIVFYNWNYYAENPGDMIMVWKGGLSFHGAVIGMVISSYLFARKQKIHFLEVTDTMAMIAGPGLFLGRLGNFINGELYGRATNVPWAMIFPTDEKALPRHPSQLYQGLTEGLLLWCILLLIQSYLIKKKKLRTGIMGALFLIGYGLFRFCIEFTREPDAQLGYFFSWITMGQILCLTMSLLGVWCLWLSRKNPVLTDVK